MYRLNNKEIQVDKDYTFTWKFYEYGIQIVPTSASITVYNNSGTSISTGTGSVGADGTVTYTLSAADNDTVGEYFKVVCTYTYNSITTTIAELFDVTNYPLVCYIHDDDLYPYMPELREYSYEHNGISDSVGSTTTLVDSRLRADRRNYKGGRISIFLSSTSTIDGLITDYSTTTGTITFSPVSTSSVGSGVRYSIRQSYSDVIDTAFDDVRSILRNKVSVAGRYIDSTVTSKATLFRALSIIAMRMRIDANDKYDLLYKDFITEFNGIIKSIYEAIDRDDDGDIDDTEIESIPTFSSIGVII